MPVRRKRVTRFVVMAVLQAARARRLGLSQSESYSWGLNRAIFYAAAKSGFRGHEGGSTPVDSDSPLRKEPTDRFRLGDEEAIRETSTGNSFFIIGDKPQTPVEFDHQVISRFGTAAHFHEAWSEAERIIAEFDRATLESRRLFFDRVYKPRRDDLSERWTEQYAESGSP
jgi:hypothetical protein